VGRKVGPIRVALYAAKQRGAPWSDVQAGGVDWIAPDDALRSIPR
jgi:hypothetical protein